jgi:hemoglobin
MPHPVVQRHPDIARLVALFYQRAQADPLIGPVFAAAVSDWDGHRRVLTGFWAAQLRGRGVYRGQPVAAHVALASRLDPAMFDRWLALWRQTAQEVMEPQDAAVLIAKATRIAGVLAQAVEAAR